MQISRDDLLSLCERAVVPVENWSNRDSSDAQRQLGECTALLKAGCKFKVFHGNGHSSDTLEVLVEYPGFNAFEYGADSANETETFYVPTPERLERNAGRDWY